jgi:cytochrome c553
MQRKQMNWHRRSPYALFAGCVLMACDSGEPEHKVAKPSAAASARDAGSAEVEVPLPGFCMRPDQDAVRDVFCGDEAPDIQGLHDLQTLLEISPTSKDDGLPYVGGAMPDNPYHAASRVAVMSHSTSLSGELVSPINPRVFVMGSKTIMAYVRGTQRIELVSESRTMPKQINFYLLSFEQACNQHGGCKPGDLFTEKVESDWTSVTIEDGKELENTPSDCRVCHQRTGEEAVLLMRELESPWTHFFLPTNLEGEPLPGIAGSDLMTDFVAAKGGEIYGGFDLTTISAVSPFIMQRRVGVRQPLFFDSSSILNERYPNGSDRDHTEANPSETWATAYDAFKRGEQLALPYFDDRATDTDKQAELTEAYRRYRDGELDADELPDLADIYPDDPALRAQIGLQTEPDASPEALLIQACGSCHNNVLDQSISRARFNIDLSQLDRAELEIARERIKLDRSQKGVMPPREARQLDEAGRARLLEYLNSQPKASDQLKHAAEMGMNGGEVTREVLL